MSQGDPRLSHGDHLIHAQLNALGGHSVTVPSRTKLTHLQFLRFAGCPICNLHLRSFTARAAEIAEAGIEEVVVFHSSEHELATYQPELPFTIIADPGRALYREYGVEPAAKSLLHPAVWATVIRALSGALAAVIRRRAAMPPMRPTGGNLGLPADFLIDTDGTLIAAHYGRHASDQWSLGELLTLAHR
jgi:peroxiredoxin